MLLMPPQTETKRPLLRLKLKLKLSMAVWNPVMPPHQALDGVFKRGHVVVLAAAVGGVLPLGAHVVAAHIKVQDSEAEGSKVCHKQAQWAAIGWRQRWAATRGRQP